MIEKYKIILRNIILLLSLLFLTACNNTQLISPKSAFSVIEPEKPSAILKLDTKGHTGIIRDIIVTKEADIISASDDKTIRVWDSKTGKEKRKILGEIGIGAQGMIFAIALSGDENYLAVGGFMGSYVGNRNKEDEEAHKIRIYNYQTGRLLHILKSHQNVVLDLSFSKDSNYLISGSADNSAKIWSVKDGFKLKETIKSHTKEVYATKIISTKNNYFAITAGYDKKIALYDIKNKRELRSSKSNYKLSFLAINDIQKHIAVCGFGREILIYDFDLNLIKKIESETMPNGLAYSRGGSYLISGTGLGPYSVNIYNKNYSLERSFKKQTNLTMAVAFLDDKTAISGGGSNKEIYIWDIDTAKVKSKIVGVSESLWSVGLNENSLAWGDKFNYINNNNRAKLQKSINLNSMNIERVKSDIEFKRVETKNATYSLGHSKGGEHGYRDAVLEVKNGNSIEAKIVKNSYDGLSHRCYSWYKNFIVSGGSNGQLKVYNKKAEEIASLVGHTGEIWSIAIDGDRLLSGGSDQTMILWDLSKIGSYKTIEPLLNIFVANDDEWVVWTKDGFFDASKNAAEFIGYHINQGSNKEARYVSVEKLYDTFYRPDLVQKALSGEDISSYAKAIDINTLINQGLAPEVAISTKQPRTSSGFKSKERDISLALEVCSIDDGGYDNLTLYLNDRAVDVIERDRALKLKKQNQTRRECFSIDKLISLQSGENKIGFKATNRAGNIESNLDEIVVNYMGRSNAKVNLHILAIGIDKYRDGDLHLNYSKADAREFTKSIQRASKPLFENIYTYSLSDDEVTKSKLLEMFESIGAKTTREDVFIFYMAGHGITDEKSGAYFYLPVDFRYKNERSVREDGVSQNDFKLALSKIQAMKSLTILDTCNSGSFAEAMASRGVLQKTAINKLTRATGRATMVASSKSQVALEGYKGHGVFTYTLMEALNGKAYDKNNKITIKGLAAYVEDVLPDRTYEKWGYEQVPQSNISGNDFPIGVK